MSSQDVWTQLRQEMTVEPSERSWQVLTERLARLDGGVPTPPDKRGLPGRGRRWRGWTVAIALGAAIVVLAVLLPIVLPSRSPGGATPAAATMLDRVAAVAARQPAHPATGRYLFMETREGDAGSIGPVGHEVAHLTTFTRYVWVAADGSGREVLTPDPNDPKPIAGIDHELPPNSSFESTRYIGSLPTTPGQLEHAIVQRFEGGHSDAAATFQFAGTFLQAGASPELRQALYLMVKQLPGVTAVGDTIDGQGRAGLAVAMPVPDGSIQLVFDPVTSAVLELRQLDAQGHLVHFVLYERAEHVAATTTPAVPAHG